MATILKNLLKLLSLTSDTIFSLTTFISIFMVTVKSYTSAEKTLHIFGESIPQLFSKATDLISDYVVVTVQHVVLSLVIF